MGDTCGNAVEWSATMMLDAAFWEGKRVLVTGHMGFKGSWLTYLLSRLGARTVGYGLESRPEPLLYRALSFPNHVSVTGDVNDLQHLCATIGKHRIQIVFHLAAQAIVLRSYEEPLRTFRDNIMGSATVLEAVRQSGGIEAVVMVTSDKVYANREWLWPYREDDALGGRDPYSGSKAAAELVIAAMVASYLKRGEATCKVATARAGNIIGGGDWAEYRLLPDAARAYSKSETLVVRNPDATRPWQHVLDPLTGYLLLAQKLVERADDAWPLSWNFGPRPEDAIPVKELVTRFTAAWGDGATWQPHSAANADLYEAGALTLDSSRARNLLGWSALWRVGVAVERTARWYREYYGGADMEALVSREVDDYFEECSTLSSTADWICT
jgi:CDP-glucose 4,6-dehydratase